MSHWRRRTRRDVLRRGGAGLAAVSLGGLAGCAGGGGDGGGATPTESGDGGTETTTKSGGGEPIKIGVLNPTSGAIAQAGNDARRGAELRARKINGAGGILGRDLELKYADTQASPDTGVKRARELVQKENVDVIIGLVSSAVAKAVNQFTANENVPLIVTAAQTPDITHKECEKTTFRTTTNIIHQQRTTAHTLDQLVADDLTRVGGINPDYVYGQQSWDIFKESFSKLRPDVEWVSEQFPGFKKGDYSKEIQATLDADPDIVHSVLYAGDMITFIKQAQQFDFFQQIEEFYADVTPIQVTTSLGDQMVEAIAIADSYYNWPEDNDRLATFTEEYRNEYDAMPTVYSMETSAAYTGLKKAVEKSGEMSTQGVIDGLEGLTFSSVVPDMTVRADDHQGVHDFYLGGRLGPLADEEFYGFTEFNPIPAEKFKDEPTCSF